MWQEWNGMGAGMALAMALFWLLVVAGTVVVVALLTGGGPQRPAPPAPGRRDAQELLDERLARGELDVDEYQARVRALRDARG